MKKRTMIIIAVLAIILVCFSLWFALPGRRPFKNLEPENVVSASVELLPPDATIQIVDIEELVSYLNDVVVYNEDNSYTEYNGQAVIFTLTLSDGSQIQVQAYNPFVIIDGVGYKCKYEPCEALNSYANRLLEGEQ